MNLHNLVTYALNAPKGLIVALVNETDKKVYLTHCMCLFAFLGRLNKEGLPTGLTNFDVKILEAGVINYPGISLAFWVDYYRNLNYTFINKTREARYQIKYKMNSSNSTVTMTLCSKNRSRDIVVGSFVSLAEAKRFEKEHYEQGVYEVVKYEG